MKQDEMDYVTITAFCKTLEHNQKINPYKLRIELKLAVKYGLKYIFIKNSKETARFEALRMIQFIEDWLPTDHYLYIDFPEGEKGINFKKEM